MSEYDTTTATVRLIDTGYNVHIAIGDLRIIKPSLTNLSETGKSSAIGNNDQNKIEHIPRISLLWRGKDFAEYLVDTKVCQAITAENQEKYLSKATNKSAEPSKPCTSSNGRRDPGTEIPIEQWSVDMLIDNATINANGGNRLPLNSSVEQVESMLEQMRLCLANGNFDRAQTIAQQVNIKWLNGAGHSDLQYKYYGIIVRLMRMFDRDSGIKKTEYL